MNHVVTFRHKPMEVIMQNKHYTDTFLNQTEVQKKFGISRTTLYRWTRDGNFPKGMRLSSNMLRWKQDDVESWLENKRGV